MAERRYPEAHPDTLSDDDVARSARTVRDLIDDDVADRRTPSRRYELEEELGGEQLEGFDVEVERVPDDRQ